MHVRVPVRVPWGYSDATVTEANSQANSACSSYTDPHSTLNGTLTYSSHNGTAYETPRMRPMQLVRRNVLLNLLTVRELRSVQM